MEENLCKKAVFSMDVEDWYHLEYINELKGLKQTSIKSTKDGILKYLNLLSSHNIKANFFIVGNFIQHCSKEIQSIVDADHEIGLHSFNHDRPIRLSEEDFLNDLKLNIKALENLGITPKGYRAPCFALGNSFLNLLAKDFKQLLFDSSFINQKEHPLYTPIDMEKLQFIKRREGIFERKGFMEFEVSTIKYNRFSIPISGGGYIRILPWFVYKFLLKKYLKTGEFYTFYIHPFELSDMKITLPKEVSILNRFRFHYNRKKTYRRIEKTISLLKRYGYSFHTFSEFTTNNGF
jgi:peptidoglycan/xylan/chitin deacetylase (PgdA/CDA1 family)